MEHVAEGFACRVALSVSIAARPWSRTAGRIARARLAGVRVTRGRSTPRLEGSGARRGKFGGDGGAGVTAPGLGKIGGRDRRPDGGDDHRRWRRRGCAGRHGCALAGSARKTAAATRARPIAARRRRRAVGPHSPREGDAAPRHLARRHPLHPMHRRADVRRRSLVHHALPTASQQRELQEERDPEGGGETTKERRWTHPGFPHARGPRSA